MNPKTPKVADHFRDKAPVVKTVYERLLAAAKALGPVREEAKKTSIHLVRRTAFAGVATRKDSLILTLKAETDQDSARIFRREQTSARRWHLEVRLTSPKEVDRELRGWVEKAYALAE